VREVIKWHLRTALEAGTLTWSTVLQRCPDLLTFDRWLCTLDDPPPFAEVSITPGGWLRRSINGSVIARTETDQRHGDQQRRMS
jgi:hypothetical protein